MGPKKQQKEPCDLAEAPTGSVTASVDLKGFPTLEVSVQQRGDGVTQRRLSIW